MNLREEMILVDQRRCLAMDSVFRNLRNRNDACEMRGSILFCGASAPGKRWIS